MKRVLLVILMGTTLAGCSWNPFIASKPGPRPETLTRRQWDNLKSDNEARLAGEGIGAGPTTRPASLGRTLDELTEFFEFIFWGLPKRIIEYYTGQTPAHFARMMEDRQSADARRTGILELASRFSFARVPPYTRRYWQIAQSDPDYLVRAAAIRALNRSRDRRAVDVYIRGLDDPYMLVRLEAAKALANVPDASAIPALVRHTRPVVEVRAVGAGRIEQINESRDVRLACADALRNFAQKDVARALVEMLRDREFEVSWQARRSLVLLTGHDYGYDQVKWRDYVEGTATPFG